jgi:hypothetical protein
VNKKIHTLGEKKHENKEQREKTRNRKTQKNSTALDKGEHN